MAEFVSLGKADAMSAESWDTRKVNVQNLWKGKIGPHYQWDRPDLRSPLLDRLLHLPEGDHRHPALYNGPGTTTNLRLGDAFIV